MKILSSSQTNNPQTSDFSFDSAFTTSLMQADFSILRREIHSPASLIICDQLVWELYAQQLQLCKDAPILLLPAGEKHKNQTTVNRIFSWLLAHQTTRSTRIIVIGGGTVLDTAAFAVSIYKRGCRLMLIPTTLLAMVDAALGGKTAINFRTIKNLIGTFYPADTVLIIPEFMTTLPPREISNGTAEMLKLWFIDPELSLPGYPLPLPDQILAFAAAKLKICTQDLNDTGLRRHLNLGHTIGHALESHSHYRISHGNAVARGMAIAALISLKTGLVNRDVYAEILSHLTRYGFITDQKAILKPDLIAQLPSYLLQDKKRLSGQLTLVLYSGLRQTCIYSDLTVPGLLKLLESPIEFR